MNLSQLQYFAALAREEHYTRAAQMLSITQPSLSHAVSLLEQELGTKLFEKRGRNVVLTKYGQLFLPYVEEALAVLEEGVKKTKSLNSQNEGEISLAYIYTLAGDFAPCLVRAFLNAYPQLKVDFNFTVGTTGDIIEGLKNGRYDMVFSSYKDREPEIDFQRIGNQKLVVVVPEGHPLAERQSVELYETIDFPYIYFSRSSGLRPVIDQLFEKIGAFPRIAFEMEEDSSMAGLVAQNFGIAVMPDILILQNMRVKTLEIKSPEYERFVYLATMKERYLPPVAKKFIRFVQESEAGHNYLK